MLTNVFKRIYFFAPYPIIWGFFCIIYPFYNLYCSQLKNMSYNLNDQTEKSLYVQEVLSIL